MVTENNSQINTFVKGMNTDTSYLMLDSQAYTFAKNLRINSVSSTEGSIGNNRQGEIKPIKGITETFLEPSDPTLSTQGKFDKILAAKTIRLYGVIISLTIDDTDSTTQPTYVWRFTNKIGQGGFLDDINIVDIDDLHLVFGPFAGPKNVNNISIDLRYEDDDNIKLYIADSIDPIMVLNIAPSQDTYNASLLGDKSKIMSYPAIQFNPPVFVKMIEGNLKPAKVLYSYRLYNKNGVATDISPTTKQIPIVDYSYQYNRETEGVLKDQRSSTGVLIKIRIDSTYNYLTDIIVYRITHEESGLLASIELIYDAKIDLFVKDSSNYIYINDTGQNALSILTYEEYNAISGIHIIPRVIESMHDRLFAANIKEVTADSTFIDEVNALDTRAYSCDMDGYVHLYNVKSELIEYTFTLNNIPDIPLDADCFNKYNNINEDYRDIPAPGDPYTSTGQYDRFDINGKYGGTGKYISWKFIYKNIAIDTSELGLDDETITNIIKTDSNYIANGTTSKIYDVNSQGVRFLVSQYTNYGEVYADPYVSMMFPSLKHNELYRYGIVFYNQYGLAAPVKWIADIRTPRMSYEGWSPFSLAGAYGEELSGKVIGIEFTIDFQEDGFPLSIVAYEIVRCNRNTNDIASLTNGVISRPMHRMSDRLNFPYTPTGFITYANIRLGAFNEYNHDVYDYWTDDVHNSMTALTDTYNILQLVTPEILYQSDYMKSVLLNSKLKICPLLYLYPEARQAEYITGGFSGGGTTPFYCVKPSISNLNIPFSWNDTNQSYWVPKYFFYWRNEDIGPVFYQADVSDSLNWYLYATDNDPGSYVFPGDNSIFPSTDITTTKKHMYAHVKLYKNAFVLKDGYQEGVQDLDIRNINTIFKINDIKFPDTLLWNDGYEGDAEGNNSKSYQDHVIGIANNQYINWVIGGEYDERLFESDAPTYADYRLAYMFNKNDVRAWVMLGPGGKCAVISTNIDFSILNPQYGFNVSGADLSSYFGTFLCDIRQLFVQPYGGYDYISRTLNTYYSYGDYHILNDSGTYDYHPYIFDGEYYPNVMEYVSMHKFYTPLDKHTGSSTMIDYAIPVYSTINLAYTSGNELSKKFRDEYVTNLQDEPASVYNIYIQDEPLYVYNAAYSAYSNVRLFASLSQEVLDEKDDYDYRCFYSNLKINDERIDSWTKFMPANYLDVDTKYGEITHMRNFHNQMIYWQESATGLFSVNERTAITDNNNMPLILGEGGVLSRYDYIDQMSGMAKDLFCDALSSNILYWFDDHDQSIRAYTEKSTPVNLTKKNYVQSIMNKLSDKNKNPKLFFDLNNGELVANVLKNAAIVYNENLNAFTALYTIPFLHYTQFLNGTYILDNYIPTGELVSYLGIAQWDCNHDGYLRSWDNKLIDTELEYVVNKSVTNTKVFDNQEIVSPNIPSTLGKLENIVDKSNIDPNSFFSTDHTYSWTTDINNAIDKTVSMTAREGNYRFAISRASNQQYGDRIRGKYMVSNIKCSKPLIDASIAYIITKFRASWS